MQFNTMLLLKDWQADNFDSVFWTSCAISQTCSLDKGEFLASSSPRAVQQVPPTSNAACGSCQRCFLPYQSPGRPVCSIWYSKRVGLLIDVVRWRRPSPSLLPFLLGEQNRRTSGANAAAWTPCCLSVEMRGKAGSVCFIMVCVFSSVHCPMLTVSGWDWVREGEAAAEFY